MKSLLMSAGLFCFLRIGAWLMVGGALAIAPEGAGGGDDPVDAMIREMDAAPVEHHPPDWQSTRSLMSRKAPAVGDPAPDFTLKTSDGSDTITRSAFEPGKPQVLIFGSFT